MNQSWEDALERWRAAGLVDESAAARIRDFEASRGPDGGLRWPVVIVLALGGLLLAAGSLLFVSAHWDDISPAFRMTLMVAALTVLHLGGALASRRWPPLSTTLHAVGTVALGGAIAMAGQIFHYERWPTAILLWALGSWAGVWLLRDWPHFTLAALLTPAWLASEWSFARLDSGIAGAFVLLTSFTYLSAVGRDENGYWRSALCWIGALALLPSALWTILASYGSGKPFSTLQLVLAFAAPMVLAVALRRRHAWRNAVCALWLGGLLALSYGRMELALDAWCAAGALGLILWGLADSRIERVNLGIAGFAIVVLFFYFSRLMDALGRSAAMIGLGVLFLAGGWLLERLRRNLVQRVRRESA